MHSGFKTEWKKPSKSIVDDIVPVIGLKAS